MLDDAPTVGGPCNHRLSESIRSRILFFFFYVLYTRTSTVISLPKNSEYSRGSLLLRSCILVASAEEDARPSTLLRRAVTFFNTGRLINREGLNNRSSGYNAFSRLPLLIAPRRDAIRYDAMRCADRFELDARFLLSRARGLISPFINSR